MGIQLRIKNYFDSTDLPVEKIIDEPYPFALEAIKTTFNPDFVRYITVSCCQGSLLSKALLHCPLFAAAVLRDTPFTENFERLGSFIEHLPKEISNDPAFIITAIKQAPESIRNEILRAIPEALLTAPTALVRDLRFLQALVAELPDDLRDDPDYLRSLMAAASTALQDDSEIEVLFSLIKNSSDDLKVDADFIFSMIDIIARHSPDVPSFTTSFMMEAPATLRNNPAYLAAVIRHVPIAYLAVPEEYLTTSYYVREIVQQAPAALRYASWEFRANPQFLRSILEQATEDQRINPDLYFALVRYADRSLQRDPDYIESILALAPEEFLEEPTFVQPIRQHLSARSRSMGAGA